MPPHQQFLKRLPAYFQAPAVGSEVDRLTLNHNHLALLWRNPVDVLTLNERGVKACLQAAPGAA